MSKVDVKMHVNKDNNYLVMHPETNSKQVLDSKSIPLSSIEGSAAVKVINGEFTVLNKDTGGYDKVGGDTRDYPLTHITDLSGSVSLNSITVNWTDPSDVTITVDGKQVTLAKWIKTVLVMKEGSAPTNINDGTTLVESTTRHQYSSTGFKVDSLDFGKTYYFKVFPVSEYSIVTNSEVSVISSTTEYASVGEITNLDQFSAGKSMYIKWNDPVDTAGSFWDRTVVVRKTGGYPASISDGVIVADYTGIRNKYSSNYLQINNLEEGDHYYKIFVFGKGGSSNGTQFMDTISLPSLLNYTLTTYPQPNGDVHIYWSDPSDIILYKDGKGYVENSWVKSVLLRKVDSYSSSVQDGTVIKENTIRNEHQDSPIIDNLPDGTYYYTLILFDVHGRSYVSHAYTTVSKIDDSSGSPGPNKLRAGDMNAGFFGEVPNTDLITPLNLASTIGLSAGTAQHNDTPWLKFIIDNKVIFVSKNPIRYGISWDHINVIGAVKGTKTVNIGGLTYKVRLIRGALTDPSGTGTDMGALGSEWNRLMLPIHEHAATGNWAYPQSVGTGIPNWGVGYTDADLVTHYDHGNGSYSWCQEVYGPSPANRVFRGGIGVSYSASNYATSPATYCGWRPVLELVQ